MIFQIILLEWTISFKKLTTRVKKLCKLWKYSNKIQKIEEYSVKKSRRIGSKVLIALSAVRIDILYVSNAYQSTLEHYCPPSCPYLLALTQILFQLWDISRN
jgi:hypothetical protein